MSEMISKVYGYVNDEIYVEELPKEEAQSLFRKLRNEGHDVNIRDLEYKINGKCQCKTEYTKIINADKSFRSDGTRYIHSDSNHEYNQLGMVYDLFRCEKCMNVISEVFVKDNSEG